MTEVQPLATIIIITPPPRRPNSAPIAGGNVRSWSVPVEANTPDSEILLAVVAAIENGDAGTPGTQPA